MSPSTIHSFGVRWDIPGRSAGMRNYTRGPTRSMLWARICDLIYPFLVDRAAPPPELARLSTEERHGGQAARTGSRQGLDVRLALPFPHLDREAGQHGAHQGAPRDLH